VVLGPRFWIEAGFILAVAVVAGVERAGPWWIIALVAAAWLAVALVEVVVWVRHARARGEWSVRPPIGVERVRVEGVQGNRALPPTPPEPAAQRPVPTEAAVGYLAANDVPREWNLWELERVIRDDTTVDVARNEERAYLLMYLREFAGPDGTLPADFDGLVRDAWGELLHGLRT
jgi:hypothetical protein